MPGAPYYAEAFALLPGRCFRMVAHHGEAGPTHCPEPVAWRGSWRPRTAAATASRPAKATGRPQPRATDPPPSLAADRRGGRLGADTPGRPATRPHPPRAHSNPHNQPRTPVARHPEEVSG